MWCSPVSRFLSRVGPAVSLTRRLPAEHPIHSWAHLHFCSATTPPPPGPRSNFKDSMSLSEAKRLVNVEALKPKLGMETRRRPSTRSWTTLGSFSCSGTRSISFPIRSWNASMKLKAGCRCNNYVTKAFDFPSGRAVYSRVVQDEAVKGTKHNDQADDQNPQAPLRKQRIGANLSAVDKRKFLVNTLMDLKDSKEAVYGTLDAWVAWEHNFPLVSLKRALLVLQKEEQWHRVVQVIKWMLSKGQGTTMGTYQQLICALEKDNRAEEAHRIWVAKVSHDLHSVPWQFCELMISIYYRNNMLDKLVKLFKGLESYERRPQNKSIVQKVADAYEMLGLLEEKNRVLEKYTDLFSGKSIERFKKSRKGSLKNKEKTGMKKNISQEANENVEMDSSPSDEEFVNIV